MRIFVAGGSGVLGRPIVRELVAAGHAVTATARRPEGARALEQLGAEPVVLDAFDAGAVHQAVTRAAPEVLVNQLTSLAAPARDYATWLEATNRLRREASRALMAGARAAGTRRVIAQSASFMTDPAGSGLTDEGSPLYTTAPEPIRSHVLANIAAEEAVLGAAGVEGVVLRYGFLYGAGTGFGPGGSFVEAIHAGAMPVVAGGTGSYPFIHVDDAVAATLAAVHHGAGVYNVVDDDPAPQAQWLPFLADLLGAPAPARVSEEEAYELGVQTVYYGAQLRPASNARARADLRLRLAHPSWRAGFEAVLGSRPTLAGVPAPV